LKRIASRSLSAIKRNDNSIAAPTAAAMCSPLTDSK